MTDRSRPFSIEIIDDGHMARVTVPEPTPQQRKLFARVAELMAVVVHSLNQDPAMSPAPVVIEGQVFEDGIICGCDCGCGTPLTDGNMMRQDVTDDPKKPWEQSEPEGPRVHLLLCADCYVGVHPA